MTAQTPRAPPIPVAAALSPILWQLNNPDRFDMYSTGVMLLQAAMPALRSDSALIAFRRKLEQCNYDLRAWRAQQVGWVPNIQRSFTKVLSGRFGVRDCEKETLCSSNRAESVIRPVFGCPACVPSVSVLLLIIAISGRRQFV